ncbi:hypothetical protein CHUAL_010658 [Chamberlinius hualienensis]
MKHQVNESDSEEEFDCDIHLLQTMPASANVWFRLTKAILNSKAELITGIYCLSYYMPSVFVQNLLIEKVCLSKYPKEICLSSTINQTVEEETQGEVAYYLLQFYLLKQIPAVILALFMGSWSDIYGRKFVLIIANVGSMLTMFFCWLSSFYTNWSPTALVLAAIPSGLSGGYAVFMLGLYGYIRDIHSTEDLSWRISSADGSESLALQIGPLLGVGLYKWYGYAAVFWACIVLAVVNVTVIGCLVDDANFKTSHLCTLVKDFFDINGFLSCIKSVCLKRQKNFRLYILYVMLVSSMLLFTENGNQNFIYRFSGGFPIGRTKHMLRASHLQGTLKLSSPNIKKNILIFH